MWDDSRDMHHHVGETTCPDMTTCMTRQNTSHGDGGTNNISLGASLNDVLVDDEAMVRGGSIGSKLHTSWKHDTMIVATHDTARNDITHDTYDIHDDQMEHTHTRAERVIHQTHV